MDVVVAVDVVAVEDVVVAVDDAVVRWLRRWLRRIIDCDDAINIHCNKTLMI